MKQNRNTQKIKTFIIHLARSRERMHQVKYIMENSPFCAEVIDAVDGENLKEEQIKVYDQKVFTIKPAYPFGLNRGELACFLSHRKAWQEIIDQNLDCALILEDDIDFDHCELKRALEVSRKYIDVFEYIQFPVREVTDKSNMLASSKDATIYKPRVTMLGACGQLVSRKAAERLLRLTVRIDRPVDTFLQMHWITNIHLAAISPKVLTEISENIGGSTLSKRKPAVEKIGRTFKRFVYRNLVKIYSRKYQEDKSSRMIFILFWIDLMAYFFVDLSKAAS